jgi:prepilin-type processing-associated H-X9-DG protein
MPPQQSATSGKAILALVFGIASFFGTILFGIPSIICAIWSMADIRNSHGRLGGKGMAITAIVLAVVGSVGSVLCGGGLIYGIARVRDVAQRAAAKTQSKNRLLEIGIAMNECDLVTGSLPPGAIYSADGTRPLLSWRVALLPSLHQDQLYQQFHLNEPWDSPHNITLLSQIPEVYQPPHHFGDDRTGYTHYRIFHMKDADRARTTDRPVFVGNNKKPLMQIERGMTNTILVVEAADAVPWTKPDELPFPVNGPVEPLLGGILKNGYNVLFADAHVTYYDKDQGNDAAVKAALVENGR